MATKPPSLARNWVKTAYDEYLYERYGSSRQNLNFIYTRATFNFAFLAFASSLQIPLIKEPPAPFGWGLFVWIFLLVGSIFGIASIGFIVAGLWGREIGHPPAAVSLTTMAALKKEFREANYVITSDSEIVSDLQEENRQAYAEIIDHNTRAYGAKSRRMNRALVLGFAYGFFAICTFTAYNSLPSEFTEKAPTRVEIVDHARERGKAEKGPSETRAKARAGIHKGGR